MRVVSLQLLEKRGKSGRRIKDKTSVYLGNDIPDLSSHDASISAVVHSEYRFLRKKTVYRRAGVRETSMTFYEFKKRKVVRISAALFLRARLS